MKRAWLVLLPLIYALVLTACGGQPDDTKTSAAPIQTVDLDLSKLSGTVVYSQVYDMMSAPDSYIGKRVRIKGGFNYYQDSETNKEYFAVIIADATACCAQGMEFVWEGNHSFPRDYPELDTEITVTGTFGTYEENGFEYIQLTDAELEV